MSKVLQRPLYLASSGVVKWTSVGESNLRIKAISGFGICVIRGVFGVCVDVIIKTGAAIINGGSIEYQGK
jgi:hypothetical protein